MAEDGVYVQCAMYTCVSVPVDSSSIGRHDDGLSEVFVLKVFESDDLCLEIIHGHSRAEESLDLPAMQIDCYDSIHAHRLDHPRHICLGSKAGEEKETRQENR